VVSHHLTHKLGVRKYDTTKRKTIKITDKHRQDYKLYEKFSTMTIMWPCNETTDPDGYSPIECFVYNKKLNFSRL